MPISYVKADSRAKVKIVYYKREQVEVDGHIMSRDVQYEIADNTLRFPDAVYNSTPLYKMAKLRIYVNIGSVYNHYSVNVRINTQ